MTITRSPIAALGAAVLACTISLTACGSAHMTPVAYAPSQTPRDQAAADARFNLAAVRLPAGAQRIVNLPASLAGVAGAPPQLLAQIDDSQYWTVRGTAQAVLSGIRAKLPRTFSMTASGTVGGLYMTPMTGGNHPAVSTSALRIPFPVMYYDGFTLPATSRLTERAVFVSVAPMASGQVLIRLDAQDSWPMQRTAASRVPDSVTSVTITAVGGGPMITSSEVTVTSPDRVRRILALVNGQPLRAAGVGFHCQARFVTQYRLVFASAGTTVATVLLAPAACDVLGLQTSSAGGSGGSGGSGASGGSALLGGARSFLTHLATITRLPTPGPYGPAAQ